MSAAATASDTGRKVWEWIRANPAQAFLLATIGATIVYFYGYLRLYAGLPIGTWAWLRYRPEYNQEHSKLIPAVFLFLIWYHREALAKATERGEQLGPAFIGLGILFYVVAARALQARWPSLRCHFCSLACSFLSGEKKWRGFFFLRPLS